MSNPSTTRQRWTTLERDEPAHRCDLCDGDGGGVMVLLSMRDGRGRLCGDCCRYIAAQVSAAEAVR